MTASQIDALVVRDASADDAAEMAELLNAVIERGGTTALEEPFTAADLAEAFVSGPDVHFCFVAIGPSGRLEGFQAVVRNPLLPEDIGDIATFARIGGTQRGVGSALFRATRDKARSIGLTAINATIRGDNAGGLAFYGKQGFRDYGVDEAVPLKSGVRIDRITKRYIIG